MTRKYSFKAKVWLWQGEAGWHFITLPTPVAKEIDFYFTHAKKGWGSLRVTVTIGTTTWQTSIFPDKKSDSYVLPLKAIVREKEGIISGSEPSLTLEIEDK